MPKPTVRVAVMMAALAAPLGCDAWERRFGGGPAPADAPSAARIVAAPGGVCGEMPDKTVVECPPNHRCMRWDTFESHCHALVATGQPCQRDSLQSTCAQGSCVPEGPDTSAGVCRVTKGDGEPCKTLYECASSSLCLKGVCTAHSPAPIVDAGARPLMPSPL